MKGCDTEFRTTHWSVVRAAAGGDSEAAREALTVLCQTYWYPLYAYVRRTGCTREDAEDLTQSFFERLLAKRDLGGADPRRGRFRAYLLGALKNFMANARDRARTAKRGGGRVAFAIDFPEADRRYGLQAGDGSSPARVFERQWALALLGRTIEKLRDDYVARGREELFDGLRPALIGDPKPGSREALAAAAGLQVGAFNTALHRLRKRFREQLRLEVAHTVDTQDQVESELRFLKSALET